ncbi:hypothetical protein KQX54_007860 [Cotesia glomerata]|uniref:Uncharacterized protein n=1 Tax=Cotesia glomerata TaxID=32391 RepID=A0AAV7J1Q5_COTGL|nr:hypothetical protein KQX54_007860 [Cotesia glomerata]
MRGFNRFNRLCVAGDSILDDVVKLPRSTKNEKMSRNVGGHISRVSPTNIEVGSVSAAVAVATSTWVSTRGMSSLKYPSSSFMQSKNKQSDADA